MNVEGNNLLIDIHSHKINLYKFFSCLLWQIYFIDEMVSIVFFSMWIVSSGSYKYVHQTLAALLLTWKSRGQLFSIWIFFNKYLPGGVSPYPKCHMVMIWSKFWLIIQKMIILILVLILNLISLFINNF